MAKKATVKRKTPALKARLNDDIGEEKRLTMYRLQLEVRHLEQRAHDLFFQNLIKGTSHLAIGRKLLLLDLELHCVQMTILFVLTAAMRIR